MTDKGVPVSIEEFRSGIFYSLGDTGEIRSYDMEKLYYFYRMLTDENKKYNLVGKLGFEQIIPYLFSDSLGVLKKIEPAPGSSCIDVGTGAGFPGMVLKIVRPDLHFCFLDSSEKKILFLRKTAKELGLENMDFLWGRAEVIGRDEAYREKFNYAVAKGLAELPVLIELCAALVKPGGKLLAWKGKKYKYEINKTGKCFSLMGLSAPEIIELNLPGGEAPKSWILAFTKNAPTPRRFPRSFQAISRLSLDGLEGKP